MFAISNLDTLHYIILAVVGLEVGSFANVCIYRWPRRQTTFKPLRSTCPWCQKTIAWYDNIPVLSFLLLKRRCRLCRSPISIVYPVIELVVPFSWIMVTVILLRFNAKLSIIFLLSSYALMVIFIITTMTDLEWKMIPDRASLALITLGLGTSFWNPFFHGSAPGSPFFESLLGLTVGGGLLLLISWIGRFFMGKEVMGGGDIKLLAGIGTYLGWEGALTTLFLASLLGGIIALAGIIFKFFRRGEVIPFGPFLNLGAALTLFLLTRRFQLFQPFFPL